MAHKPVLWTSGRWFPDNERRTISHRWNWQRIATNPPYHSREEPWWKFTRFLFWIALDTSFTKTTLFSYRFYEKINHSKRTFRQRHNLPQNLIVHTCIIVGSLKQWNNLSWKVGVLKLILDVELLIGSWCTYLLFCLVWWYMQNISYKQ